MGENGVAGLGVHDIADVVDSPANTLRLQVLEQHLSVCKCEHVPTALLDRGFCSITRTESELSIVCETTRIPSDTTVREDGWRALMVCGPLDFGLIGILAKIASALAEAGVPLFAVSTFDTDYILVKEELLQTAIAALRAAECAID